MTSELGRVMGWLSDRINRMVAKRYGDTLPLISVVEYPRSGGTWIAELVSDVLELPFPKGNIFPLAAPGTLHSHWSPNDEIPNVVYVVRDGRDVAVSQYFRAASAIMEADDRRSEYYARHYRKLARQDGDLYDCKRYLKYFLSDWFYNPTGANESWSDHIRGWLCADPRAVVRYEEFNRDAISALDAAVQKLSGRDVEEKVLAAAVYKYSFERQTGRSRGDQEESAGKRKGVSGDWENYFSRETGKMFEEECGEMLRTLGYTTDSDWFKEISRDREG